MINSEDDVRAWVREASGGKARWVEPALGSTPGLPDCWVPWAKVISHYDDDGQFMDAEEIPTCVHLELKCGIVGRNNMMSYSLRPEQRKQIMALMDDKQPVGLCVGIKGTNSVFFLKATPQTLHGSFSMFNHELAGDRMHGTVMDPKEFWRGVNFIFLNSG